MIETVLIITHPEKKQTAKMIKTKVLCNIQCTVTSTSTTQIADAHTCNIIHTQTSTNVVLFLSLFLRRFSIAGIRNTCNTASTFLEHAHIITT